jgi:hypothetical protein
MRIDGQTLLSQPRTEGSRITVVPASALLDASDAAPADIAKTLETLRVMGGMSARVVESGPGNRHVLDFSGTRITLKLAQSHAVGDLLAVLLAETAETGSAANDVRLSASGQLINAALRGDAAEETAAPLLSDSAPTDAGKLATALRKAVQETGIFYESHLATWLEGQTTLEELRQEPKALLGRQQEDGDALSAPLAALVRRQLDALETRSIDWRGTLWPGQSGEIGIREDGRNPADSGARTWSTRIRMSLPQLGDIDARISLSGNRVRLDMDAPATTAGRLQAGGAQLREALAARGLAAERLEVNSHG